MKKFLYIIIFFMLCGVNSFAYKILYAEQFYKLYHSHFLAYPENINENILYLERALASPFVNPLNALTKIDTPEQWERYRHLFRMHVNLEMVKQYRLLASKYDKRNAYFFNYPFRDTNLKSLEMAEYYYNICLYYWREALEISGEISEMPYIHLRDIQYWEDEHYRIRTGDLNYQDIIQRDLDRLVSVREAFLAMDETTY